MATFETINGRMWNPWDLTSYQDYWWDNDPAEAVEITRSPHEYVVRRGLDGEFVVFTPVTTFTYEGPGAPTGAVADIRVVGVFTHTGLGELNLTVGQIMADTKLAFSGDDRLLGGAGYDRLMGGPGNDSLWGGEGVDQLTGGEGDDTLNGGPAADYLWGDAGHDLLISGDGGGGLIGGDGNDTLLGGFGQDGLLPGLGDDLIVGGAGGENLARPVYWTAGDVLDLDGLPAATVDLALTGPQQTGSGLDTIQGVEDVLATRFDDWLAGDGGPNRLFGRDGDDHLLGRGGDDHLYGGVGADRLEGGDGDDLLYAVTDVYQDAGGNRLYGGAGADTLIGGGHGDLLEGGAGNDRLSARFFGATLDGGDGDDTLGGGSYGPDLVLGGAGNDFFYLYIEEPDTIRGGDGDDTVFLQMSSGIPRGPALAEGGAGFDVLNLDRMTPITVYLDQPAPLATTGTVAVYDFELVTIANNTGQRVLGGERNDWIIGNDGRDTLHGGGGSDTLVGGWGPDTLIGGAGDDLLNGGTWADLLDGGPGYDTVILAGASTDYRLDWTPEGQPRLVHLRGGDDTDILRDIEAVSFAGDGVHKALRRVEGTSAQDSWLGGSSWADHILGFEGDDQLFGGAGDDTLDGGSGWDQAVFDGRFDAASFLRAADGGIVVASSDGRDRLVDVEAVWFNADETWANLEELVGPYGTAANDAFLSGTGRSDALFGLAGDDQLAGWGGDDTLDGGSGWDQAVFDGMFSAARFLRNADGSVTVTSSDGTDRLIGVEAVWFNADATWSALVDLVGDHGTQGPDGFLNGTGRSDRLFGLAGDDQLAGWGGDDTLDGGAGWDQAVFDGRFADASFRREADGGVTVTSSDGVDRLIGVEAVWFNGDETWRRLDELLGPYGG